MLPMNMNDAGGRYSNAISNYRRKKQYGGVNLFYNKNHNIFDGDHNEFKVDQAALAGQNPKFSTLQPDDA